MFDRLIELLKEKPLHIHYKRRKNAGIGRTLPFGIIYRRHFGLGRSSNNRKYPEHYKELLKIAQQLNIDCNWTSIMLNDNFKSAPHIDKENDGISCIVGFGDYENGEINVESKKYNIKYTPLHMDASTQLHYTEDWIGSRYTIIFFRVKLKKPAKDKYMNYGFKEMNDLLGDYDDADIHHQLN